MRCTFERECTAQILLDAEKQKLKVVGRYEYRKMGITVEDRGWCFRITRILLLTWKLFPGIILGICNFSRYTRSIRILANEISTGKERTYHYIRTFAENSPRLEAGADFLKTALRISAIKEQLFSAKCAISLQFDDGILSKDITIEGDLTKQALAERIETIKTEYLEEVSQKRASLQKITLVAMLGNNAAKTAFSLAKIEYNTVTSNDTSFITEVPQAVAQETLARLTK